jgi:NAD(P)-dependent dehydrogenase (short-subunit alcohol dehydrogenase family)
MGARRMERGMSPARTPARIAVATWLLLVLAVAGAPARAAEESVAQVLAMAAAWAGLLRDSIPILDRRPDPETIHAAVDEARRAVSEIDRLSANAAIFQAAPAERQRLQDLAATAHLNLALFETHGLDFDRARQEIARARSLSDIVEGEGFRTEWVSLQAGQPGRALQTRFNLLTLAEFEAALGSIWYRARPVPIEFRGFTTQDLGQVHLVPAASPPAGSLEERLLLRGAAVMRVALDHGQSTFTVPLPAGLYRLQGRPGGDIDRGFVVPESTDVDTVLVDRARFALRIDPKPGPKPPRFFLNGLEVTELSAIPYGVYRLKVDAEAYPTAPQIVRFVLGEGIPDKTRTSWTIYVPGGSTSVLTLDRGQGSSRRH